MSQLMDCWHIAGRDSSPASHRLDGEEIAADPQGGMDVGAEDVAGYPRRRLEAGIENHLSVPISLHAARPSDIQSCGGNSAQPKCAAKGMRCNLAFVLARGGVCAIGTQRRGMSGGPNALFRQWCLCNAVKSGRIACRIQVAADCGALGVECSCSCRQQQRCELCRLP